MIRIGFIRFYGIKFKWINDLIRSYQLRIKKIDKIAYWSPVGRMALFPVSWDLVDFVC